MIAIDTIGAHIANDFTVSAHCHAQECRHWAELDLVALGEHLGMNFVTVGDPNPLVKLLRCQKCGGKDLGLILSPITGYTNGPVSHGPFYAEVDPADRPPVKTRRARRRGPL
jgi:hypothetical protein